MVYGRNYGIKHERVGGGPNYIILKNFSELINNTFYKGIRIIVLKKQF